MKRRMDHLKGDSACSGDWLSVQIIEGLLKRAECESDRVAQMLFLKIDLRLQQLEMGQEKVSQIDTDQRGTDFSGRLTGLLESIQPDAPDFNSDSMGAEFDEYLQQQEINILQAMVGGDHQQERLQVDRDHGVLIRSSRYRKHQQLQNSANRLVNIAIENSPQDPGPLNPEMLSIKSLKLLRDLSPQYLNRFVAYIDSLQWIEESAAGLSIYSADSGNPRSKTNKKRAKKPS